MHPRFTPFCHAAIANAETLASAVSDVPPLSFYNVIPLLVSYYRSGDIPSSLPLFLFMSLFSHSFLRTISCWKAMAEIKVLVDDECMSAYKYTLCWYSYYTRLLFSKQEKKSSCAKYNYIESPCVPLITV